MTKPLRPGASPPPDVGLQAERTSLSWARTWAVFALVLLLLIRLVGRESGVLAVVLAAFLVVPAVGLLLVRRGHERRVDRFRRAGLVHQTRWQINAAFVVLICVVAAIAVVFTLLYRP